MPSLHTKAAILPLLAISLFSFSCAGSNQTAVQQAIAGSRVQLESGDFQEALDSYKAASQKYPRDESLAAGYAEAVEEIKGAADSALEKGNLGLAEKIHRVLLENFSDFKSFDLKLSFSEASLRSQIKNGRMAMCEKQARQALPTGDFQKALDAYEPALKEYPGDPAFAANFLTIIEEFKRSADSALEKGNLGLAEKIHRVLLENFSDFKSFDLKLSFSEASLRSQIKNGRMAMCEKQARQALPTGDFQKALDAYEPALKEYPGDPPLTAKYIKIIEEIKAVGENSLVGREFALAGKAYYALWKDFSDFKSFEKQLSFGRDILKAGLDKSRKSLSQKGMEQYRKGKLAEAVSIWESLLVFDPDNADIKKSIETGKSQLKKLQQKK